MSATAKPFHHRVTVVAFATRMPRTRTHAMRREIFPSSLWSPNLHTRVYHTTRACIHVYDIPQWLSAEPFHFFLYFLCSFGMRYECWRPTACEREEEKMPAFFSAASSPFLAAVAVRAPCATFATSWERSEATPNRYRTNCNRFTAPLASLCPCFRNYNSRQIASFFLSNSVYF